MEHERSTLEAVINARNNAVSGLQNAKANPADADAIKALAAAETTLTGSLGKLFALVEAYPDLKASENMQQFQEELTTTENKVAFARQAFNDSVMSYNISREVFPGNLIAGWFSFYTCRATGDRIGREARGSRSQLPAQLGDGQPADAGRLRG